MSSTAPFKSHVLFPTEFDADDQPTDTYYAQVLANNIAHMADQAGQVRVAWITDTAVGGGNVRQPHLLPELPVTVAVFQRVAAFGPFPVRRVAGKAYVMRVRLAGYLGAAGTVEWRMVWSAPGNGRADMFANGSNVLAVPGVVSTSPGWIGTAQLTLSDQQLRQGRQRIRTRISLASAEAHAVDVALTQIEIWVRSSTAAIEPRTIGVYAAEYFGDGLPS